MKAWQKVFPTTVKPYSEMSADLMDHVRYPEDFFKVQRELLNRYHVTDANSFYANDDVWQTPKDPTQDKATDLPPYYMSLQMPGDKRTRFSLTSSFIPQQSDSNTRNVMYGFVSANGDAGTGKDGVKDPEYGKMNLLELPPDPAVWGEFYRRHLLEFVMPFWLKHLPQQSDEPVPDGAALVLVLVRKPELPATQDDAG